MDCASDEIRGGESRVDVHMGVAVRRACLRVTEQAANNGKAHTLCDAHAGSCVPQVV